MSIKIPLYCGKKGKEFSRAFCPKAITLDDC